MVKIVMRHSDLNQTLPREPTTIGLISPGQMGASIGAAALSTLSTNTRVIWAGDGRSDESHQRATKAGLTDCRTLDDMVQTADTILSVCPPHDAENLAQRVSDLGFDGLFVDCNAIAPEKSRRITKAFPQDHYVDGGIVGGPAWKAESGTVLYLSGKNAGTIAGIFADSPLHTHIISDAIGAASAMKMVFAAYTKGSTALLTAILGVAEKEGVRSVLEQQWGAEFTEQSHRRVTGNSAKAWRFTGEMREIADTFETAGLSGGFHNAAAEVFEQLAGFKDEPAEDIETLLLKLLAKP